MQQSYWSRIAEGRLSRRRAIIASGAVVSGAALLAACGGGDKASDGTSSGLVTQATDTTKQAKRGGVLKDRAAADTSTLDIATPISPLNPPAKQVYSTLVREKPGYLGPSKSELVPDIAESWETSPDGLTVTLKLRQGVKFHNKPPVSGRSLDGDDVLFSWARYSSKSPGRGNVVNAVNPDAPVLSFTAADPRTIVIKLKEPLVYLLNYFASWGSFSGNVVMVPKETDSTFDIRSEMIGTGPFSLANYTTSVGFTLKRNPEHWDKDWALVDQIDLPIIAEYAAVLAQLKAGNIHYFLLNAADILSVKREQPQLLIFATDHLAEPDILSFGLLPAGKSPFLDERVRQAVSMSWDRDLWLDTIYNVSGFRAEGLPVETRWSTALAANWLGWWLDPQSKDFGPNAKYYQHDIAEGKKLLAAAGYPNGIQNLLSNYIPAGRGQPTPVNPKFPEVLDGMASDIGITTKVNTLDYANEYIPLYRDGQGQYEGWTYHSVSGGIATRLNPVSALAAEYWSKSGITFRGFSTSGQNDKSGDPQVNALIEKARVEQDTEKRRTLVYDIQRYLAKSMYGLVVPGGSSGFTTAWPCVGNFGVHRGPSVSSHYGLWIDESKPPFKTA